MRVLLVEDNQGYAALVAAQLEGVAPGGFDIEVVDCVAAACDRLFAERVDCVLLDLGLPDADGLGGLARVRTAALGTPIVVLIGHRDDDLALRAVREGAQDYLVKGDITDTALARALRHGVERARIQAELAHQAMHDGLTGLPNRTLFCDRLRQALNRLGRTDSCLAVMFVDLDGFKEINDEHGHAAGDRLLVGVGDRLRSLLRGGDTAARLGGDEFVVLCEDLAGAEEAWTIGARMLDDLGTPASLGIAVAVRDEDPEDLLRRADAAMYAAKRDGGGTLELSRRPLAAAA